jgi:diguanylate cyclase (GGDEF)-like protein
VAERIRHSVSRIDLAGDAPGGRITVSLGVSSKTPDQSSDFSELMEQADRALYAAKRSGRDRVCAAGSFALNGG